MPRKVRPIINPWAVITNAIEQGIEWGWMHAYKHTDTPAPEAIKQHIYDDVVNALSDAGVDWDWAQKTVGKKSIEKSFQEMIGNLRAIPIDAIGKPVDDDDPTGGHL